MSVKTSFPFIFSGDFLTLDEANPTHTIGELMATSDGRAFRYTLAGGTTLVVGTLQQAAAEDTGDQNITPTAAAIGATSIVTSSTMTVTANQYTGGWVVVSVTPGIGYQYRILRHAAFTAAAATFYLEDPIQVALTTTSRIDFVPNPFANVVVAPATLTSAVCGIAVNNITNAQYGWLQVAGVGTVTNDAAGAITVGNVVMPSSSVAGSIRALTGAQQAVGRALTGIAASEAGAALLSLL